MADPLESPEDPDRVRGGLAPEAIVRRVALVVVPLLLVGGYLLRSREPEEASARASASARTLPPGASEPDGSALGVRTPPASPNPSAIALYGERAGSLPEAVSKPALSPPIAPPPIAPVPPEPLPPEPLPPEDPAKPAGVPAVELPAAEPELTVQRQAPPSLDPVSPCGGLFVRLITQAEDKQFSSASIAKGYAEPAQLLHVGESIGGYRLTGIEWDRVWVQGAGERCALGMHFGARDAQENTEKQLSAEEYARLPWVLPEAIVSGLDKRAEMDFELDSAAISALYQRGADVFAGLRVKPSRKGTSEVHGLELHDVLMDSFLERLGIEAGDVLYRIDERPIRSVADVIEALKEARTAERLVAHLLRDGEAFELALAVRRRE